MTSTGSATLLAATPALVLPAAFVAPAHETSAGITVKISSESPALHTETTQVGTVLDASAHSNLPLNRRNFIHTSRAWMLSRNSE